jgi:hypothetical protein
MINFEIIGDIKKRELKRKKIKRSKKEDDAIYI